MTQHLSPEEVAAKLIIRGGHMVLTDALKQIVTDKAARLLRHEPRIVRIRIDLEHHTTASRDAQFAVTGLIEIAGPDIVASASSDDAYKSIDLMVDKLDKALRRRNDEIKEKRQHPHAIELDAPIPKTDPDTR